MLWVCVGLVGVLGLGRVSALDNGAADTPPLGWCSWQRYRCAIACNDSTSINCFNERLIRDTADAMAASPLKSAGYEYVALDDCWQGPRRVNGHVVADPNRFPSGIKALAAYVHSKGLKFGLYTAVGNFTCASGRFAVDPIGLGCDYDKIAEGCPVAKQDIEDFVSWDIDHIKVDGCGGFDQPHMNHSYDLIGQFLQDAVKKRGTGPVVYHPSNLGFEFPRQFRELAAISNQWRFQSDVQDSWESVAGIMAAIGAGQPECTPGPLPANCTGRLRGAQSVWCASFCVERDEFLRVPSRGGWHDPDMLLAGETPCTPAATKAGMQCSVLPLPEQKSQLAVWAMSSAPLLLSADLTNIPNDSMAILTNRDVLAVNQDPLGRMAFRFASSAATGVDLWRKELVGGDVAVAIVYMGTAAQARAKTSSISNAEWISTGNRIYSDNVCPDLGSAVGCTHVDASKLVECCEASCLLDASCTALNINPTLGRCLKRGCGPDNISKPDWFDGNSWSGYHMALPRPPVPPPPPPPPPLAAGFSVDLTAAGFAADTRIRAKDLFEGTDLGVYTQNFTTSQPIPWHGVTLLRLSYEPFSMASRSDL